MNLESLRRAATLLPLALLAACDGIGEGNGPASIEIVMDGERESGEVFECLAATPQAILTFDSGSSANFARRAQWSSSDESVFVVSDGSFEAADGTFFVNGALLPLKAGEAELTVRYLDFEDSIPVTVSPTKIELSPHDHTVVQGNQLQLVATGIAQGVRQTSSLDMSTLGRWSVTGAEGGDPISSIVSSDGRLTANAGVEGIDRVSFAVPFCNRELSVDVNITNQTLQSISLVRASDPGTPLDSVSLPPDASVRLRTIGHYSGGLELNLTGAVSYDIADTTVAYTGVRGSGVLTSFNDVPGQSTELTARFDPDSSVEGDELLSNTVSVRVLDVTLQPETLAIAPTEALMLNGSTLQFAASGRFSGTDGEIDWDLTRDVSWGSSNSSVLLLSNTNGSRGFAISSGDLEDIGVITVSAIRQLGDGPTAPPTASVTVGAVAEDDPVVEVVGLSVSAPEASVSRGTTLALSAVAELASDTLSGSQTITQLVTWRSSDESVAVVGNAAANRGVVTVVSDAQDQAVRFTATFASENQETALEASIELTINPSGEAQK